MSKDKRYAVGAICVEFEVERDGDMLVASSTTLPGCITQGKTLAELDSNMRDAADLFISSLVKAYVEGRRGT